jgi:hypothetical protein
MILFPSCYGLFISISTNSSFTDRLLGLAIINIIMTTNSREWAKFKRQFVGPIMPRRIRKERREGQLATTLKGNNIDLRSTWDRHATHNKACPNWANKDAIDIIYKTAKELSKSTGISYEVDHVIPVRHPLVCGLHVENNLEIILKDENRAKSNYFVV